MAKRRRWGVRLQGIKADEMHSLGPYVYWELHKNPDHREWGTWGRLAFGISLVWWNFGLVLETEGV